MTHHCGSTVPLLANRIPQVRAAGKGEIMKLTKPPMEYFKRFYGDTVLGGSTAALMCGHAFFCADHLLLGADYPYPGGTLHDAIVQAIEGRSITEEEKTKMFSRNAEHLLRVV